MLRKTILLQDSPPPPQKNCLSFRREREGGSLSERKHIWKFWVKNKWTNSQNCVFFYLKFCNKSNFTWPMAEKLVWGKTLGTREGTLIQDNQITSTKQLTSINLCWRIAEIKIDHFFWVIFHWKTSNDILFITFFTMYKIN